MGYYEENILYKNKFFSKLIENKSVQKLKTKRPEPILEPMGIYETLPGHDIIEDDSFFGAFGAFESEQFQTYLKNMRLFSEKIRLELEEES